MLPFGVAQSYEIADIVMGAIDVHMEGVYTCLIAQVTAYDSSKLTVDCQPLTKQGYINEVGARAATALPIIPSVPLMFPGAGGMRITFPVQVGDRVLLCFSMHSIDRLLASDGSRVVDPGDDRRHDLSGAVAIPGFQTLRSASPANADAMVIEGDDIRLGDDGASNALILESAFKSALNTLLQSIASAVGTSGTVPTAVTSAATIVTAITTFMTSWTSYLSQKVKTS